MIAGPIARPFAAPFLLLLLFLSPAWAVIPRAGPSPPSENPRVLILIGPQYGLPMLEAVIPPLVGTLTDGGFSLDDIFVEFLDLQRNDDPEHRTLVLALLRNKLADSRDGLIIAVNQGAVDFVIQEGADLLPDAPMLIPIQEKQPDWRNASRKLITLISRQDAEGTLRHALNLFPDTRRAAVIMGKDDHRAPFVEPISMALAALPRQLKVETTAHLSWDEMLKLVANLPRDAIAFYGSYFEDITGRSFVPAEVAGRVAEKANVPVFAFRDMHIAQGLTGGSVAITSDLGRQAGRIALDYLQGRLRLTHPVTAFDVPNAPLFDWQQLQRWGADVRKLPENTIFLNRPTSSWDEHMDAVFVAVVSFTLLLLLAAALIIINRRQKAALVRLRQTEKSLWDSEEQHRWLFETMAQGVIYQAADGTIISANPAAERILGLSFDQMRGKTSMDPRWKMIKADGSEVPGTEHPGMVALRTGETVGPVIRGVFHPGRNAFIWLSITAIPLCRAGESQPFEAYATFNDITRQKMLNDQLEQHVRDMEQRYGELESFRNASVGRELDMIALKRRINELSRQLGQAEPYDLGFADALPEDERS
ncbi:PAS domain S-box protein [Desulfonatronum thiodismutans]|uniref:PAS domain S-box protein n=1 Tax=Desulfonatronum thiodismutans TaxID=159290 RepID=UPI0004ABD689|nr:PAS domain S-box protein [Desulfonatronum thiodismutans]